MHRCIDVWQGELKKVFIDINESFIDNNKPVIDNNKWFIEVSINHLLMLINVDIY